MKARDALQFQRVGLQVVHCNNEEWLHLVRWSRRWSGIQWQLNLPSSVLLMTILWLSSRFHLMDGSGLPFALQRRVTLSPSRTMTSLEVSASSMFGGTVRERERERGMKGVGYYYSCRLNINSKQVAPAAELDLNAKTFAFWQRLERHESGNSHSTD